MQPLDKTLLASIESSIHLHQRSDDCCNSIAEPTLSRIGPIP
jgi:hypothetical protein